MSAAWNWRRSKRIRTQSACESGLGTCLRFLTRYEESLPHAERALALAKERKEANREMEAEWALGDSLRMLTRFTDAMPRYERGLNWRRSRRRPSTNACVSPDWGPCLRFLTRYEESLPHYERALALAKERKEANRGDGGGVGPGRQSAHADPLYRRHASLRARPGTGEGAEGDLRRTRV
ncbi:MAG: tetratricopeptide repeat protein [Dehalococcoidia bacterium]|nr:tetratricopeptide repeat protein [Dehalococcoidia bacterium]